MPSLRQTSATVTPLSACCNANTICDSVNLDFFMAIVRLHPVINCPLFSILFWQRFKGGGHFWLTNIPWVSDGPETCVVVLRCTPSATGLFVRVLLTTFEIQTYRAPLHGSCG